MYSKRTISNLTQRCEDAKVGLQNFASLRDAFLGYGCAALVLIAGFDQISKFVTKPGEDSAAGYADSTGFHVEFFGDVRSGATFDGNFPESVPGAFFKVLLDQL